MKPLLPHRIRQAGPGRVRPWYPPHTEPRPARTPASASATPIYDQLAAERGFDPLEVTR